MSKPFKTRPDAFNQRQLFPTNVFDLLPDDHECYLYADIMGQLDTSEIEKTYSNIGQRAYHPRLIVSILIYAYSRGVFSSREIEKRCNEDLSFMFIAEMNCPNFRVLSDFRKNNSEFFEDCFKQSVLLAMELGLASLGHVSLDGSKFKADTSKHKAMSLKRLREKIMGKKGSGFGYQYNGQICVDEDCQIIVAQFISQNVNDKKEVKPALEIMHEITGILPSKLSADNGYMSADNLEALENVGLEAYIATNKGEKKNKISLDESNRKITKVDFVYDEKNDFFTCPVGQTLELKNVSKDGKKTYQGSSEICDVCKYKNRCCKSKKGEARTISTDDKEPLRQKMNEKMELESSKEIYKQRKIIVEPVFGQIKNTGFRGFSVRGLEKTSGEFSLVCTVHNIKKIMRAVFKGVLRSESGKLEKVMV